MQFVAVDVETANPDLASICQIGIVSFESGRPVDAWQTLVDPEDDFDPFNVAVHGIKDSDVRGAPTLPQVHARLNELLCGRVVAHHSPFDRAALDRAAAKHKLPPMDCSWLDTTRVARRAWPEFAVRGYGLANLARHFGVDFRHHAAHEDARAAGEILCHALTTSGVDLPGWLDRVRQPINIRAGSAGAKQDVARIGNAEGPLAGEKVVFTGALSMTRQVAADVAAEAGCDVAPGVNRETTLLVVGDQDIKRLAGLEKSAKHRKAEELRAKGQPIRILAESDFLRLVEFAR